MELDVCTFWFFIDWILISILWVNNSSQNFLNQLNKFHALKNFYLHVQLIFYFTLFILQNHASLCKIDLPILEFILVYINFLENHILKFLEEFQCIFQETFSFHYVSNSKYRNKIINIAGMKITDQISLTTYYLTSIIFQLLSYPFLTVQRRLECRSNEQFGLY